MLDLETTSENVLKIALDAYNTSLNNHEAVLAAFLMLKMAGIDRDNINEIIDTSYDFVDAAFEKIGVECIH
jgi:hypothetical protein